MEKKIRLLANVEHSVLLYRALVRVLSLHWVRSPLREVKMNSAASEFGGVAAYYTVSYETVNLLAGIFPIEFVKEMETITWDRRKKK